MELSPPSIDVKKNTFKVFYSNNTSVSSDKVLNNLMASNNTQGVNACTNSIHGFTPLPNGADRHSLTQIRKPEAVAETWLKMNGMNDTDINALRSEKANVSELYTKINLIDNYISPSALGNRPDLLTSLLDGDDSSFSADYGQVVINVHLPKGQATQNSTFAVPNMRALASFYMRVVKTTSDKCEQSQMIIKKVEELVGVMQKSDIDDIITNPNYVARFN
jgi:hypothetical protein